MKTISTSLYEIKVAKNGQLWLRAKTKNVRPSAVRIDERMANYLSGLEPDTFNAAAVWDFGCGVFQAKSGKPMEYSKSSYDTAYHNN